MQPTATRVRRLATVRSLLRRKARQTLRLSRKTVRLAFVLSGASVVALVSLGFSWLADLALEWNRELTHGRGWVGLLLLPFGLAALRWLTLRLAPQAVGSGIPQVIGALSLPNGAAQGRLVSLAQAAWKIPLTFLGMLCGASIGREGPAVQVGAAAMLAWGRFWQGRLQFIGGFQPRELIAAGAAGGLAAAFNAPLAGVVFAIEELGRGASLRWDRFVLIGVLACGLMVVAVIGNNPYFGMFGAADITGESWVWLLIAAVVNGVLGGWFARTLIGGPTGLVPRRWRPWVRRHPIWVAFVLGFIVALIGLATGGATFGTGYDAAASVLAGHTLDSAWFGIAKWLATVGSYLAGIPGGIFTPALTVGSGIGEHLWHLAGGAVDLRLIGLISMTAFLAAATQAPITAGVVVMEMTGSQSTLFALLVVALVASVVSRQFCPRPFYHTAAARFRHDALQASR